MARAGNIVLSGLALLISTVVCASARADVVVGEDGTPQPIDRHRALLVHTGTNQEIIEELYLTSRVQRAVWIKPLPSNPTYGTTEDPFSVLESATTVPEPFNQSLRQKMFGPSMMTLLNERVFRDRAAGEADEAEPSEPRPLSLSDRQVFRGSVTSSTVTRAFEFPGPMREWLRTRGFTLPPAIMADLATHMNRGASVALAQLEDPAPGSPGLARAGPVRFSMRSTSPVFPTMRRSGVVRSRPEYELFAVGSTALTPTGYPTFWDAEPWRGERPPSGEFHTTYAQRLGATNSASIDLEQRLGLSLPADAFLIRSRFRQGREALGEIRLEPNPNPVPVPGSDRQGSGSDLLLCILLGLTPLIYTPESWFLLWLGARAREARSLGKPAFGAKLWPLFALGVALYWASTLEGAARLAAFLPSLLGLFLLIKPMSGRAPGRVRVDFKPRRKS